MNKDDEGIPLFSNKQKRDALFWVWLSIVISSPSAVLAVFWYKEIYEMLGIADDDED